MTTIAWRTAVNAITSAMILLASTVVAHATTYYLQIVKSGDDTSATGFVSNNVSGFIPQFETPATTGRVAGVTFIDNIDAIYSPDSSPVTGFKNNPSHDGYGTLAAARAMKDPNPSVAPTGAHNAGSGSWTAAPEPANWGLMLIGFAVVGSAMRRRQPGADAAVPR